MAARSCGSDLRPRTIDRILFLRAVLRVFRYHVKKRGFFIALASLFNTSDILLPLECCLQKLSDHVVGDVQGRVASRVEDHNIIRNALLPDLGICMYMDPPH